MVLDPCGFRLSNQNDLCARQWIIRPGGNGICGCVDRFFSYYLRHETTYSILAQLGKELVVYSGY